MYQYHKIQTVFKRDPETNYKTVREDEYSTEEFELLQSIPWICTEKVDGTNIRIIWDGNTVTIKGKSDKAEIPKHLNNGLTDKFTSELFTNFNPNHYVCLYGEGVGYKIQKNGHLYIPDGVSFILFDIKIDGMWLSHDKVCGIAENLDIDVVPLIGIFSLPEAVKYAKNGFSSAIGNCQAEGLVMKPQRELFDRKGNRIITKIKCSDF